MSHESHFTSHTAEAPPEGSKELVDRSVGTYGFLPNLHAVLAESPIAYESYLTTFGLFESSSLSPLEQQVVFMAANHENSCHYCLPAHSFLMTLGEMPADAIAALRKGEPLVDEKLETLRSFTVAVIRKQGRVSDAELDAFFAAGYTRQQALDIVAGIASKVISNYVNAMARTDLDEPVQPYSLTDEEQAASQLHAQEVA